jgi:hypothetical protein
MPRKSLERSVLLKFAANAFSTTYRQRVVEGVLAWSGVRGSWCWRARSSTSNSAKQYVTRCGLVCWSTSLRISGQVLARSVVRMGLWLSSAAVVAEWKVAMQLSSEDRLDQV